jgi:hypothetical protein
MNDRSKFLCFLLLFSGHFLSCANNAEKKASSTDENKDFYPVSAFIRQELKNIDSLPVAVFLYTEKDGKTDTTIVDKAAFRVLAEGLTNPDISAAPLRDAFTESVFLDATLNLVTMSYRPRKDKATAVQKIDVYIHPETEQVKSIYIEKLDVLGDSSVQEKTVWSAGKQAQITRIVSRAGQPDRMENRRFSWGMQ